MHSTIAYYNFNAKNFIENTQNVDMHLAQGRFLRLLESDKKLTEKRLRARKAKVSCLPEAYTLLIRGR